MVHLDNSSLYIPPDEDIFLADVFEGMPGLFLMTLTFSTESNTMESFLDLRCYLTQRLSKQQFFFDLIMSLFISTMRSFNYDASEDLKSWRLKVRHPEEELYLNSSTISVQLRAFPPIEVIITRMP